MGMALVDIYNLALSACGTTFSISSPDEQSAEGNLCRLWYPRARDSVLSAAPWPSVRKYSRLALVSERLAGSLWNDGDPDPRFLRAFALPSDLAVPYYLQSYAPFAYGLVGGVRRISTNEEAPILYYNSKAVDPSAWEEPLCMAVVYTLAFHMAKPLTGRSSARQENAQLATNYVETAAEGMANSQDQQEEVLPDWITARGYGADTAPIRFFYPMSTFSLVGAE
jgi:hypothetical protein